MLRTMAASGGLVIRAPFQPASEIGDPCQLMMIG
jgi:hypothetical protein